MTDKVAKVKALKAVKPKVNQDLVTLMNQIMEQVLSGQVTGIVMLTNNVANEYNYGSAGDMQMSEVMNAFASWEFDQRIEAWKEQNSK
jgi:hypothetical protein